MTFRTSCFNRVIFLRDLRRSAPLWLAYLVVMLVLMPVSMFSNYANDVYFRVINVQHHILDAAAICCGFASFVYGAVAAWLLWYHLFQTKSTYFYAALPIRRETMFLTHCFSGLILAVIPNAVCALLTYGTTCMLGCPMASECLQWFASVTLSYIFFFSFATLCCMVIGQVAAMPILYVVLNFTFVVLEAVVRVLLESFVYGLPSFGGDLLLQKLSPVYEMLASSVSRFGAQTIYNDVEAVGVVFNGWGYLAVLAAVGIAFAAISLLLFRKREMERSGDVIAVRWLRPVFLYAFTLGCALVLTQIVKSMIGSTRFSHNFYIVMGLLLLSACVGNLAARMMLQKSLRVFRRGWRSYFLCCLVLVLCFGAMRADIFGYSRRVPDAADVKAVSMQFHNGGYLQYPVTDREAVEQTVALHQRNVDERKELENLHNSATYVIAYEMTDGSVMTRRYNADSENTAPDGVTQQLHKVYNSVPYVLARELPSKQLRESDFIHCTIDLWITEEAYKEDREFDVPVAVPKEVTNSATMTVGSEQAYELYTNAVLPDLMDTTLGHSSFPFWYKETEPQHFSCRLEFSYYTDKGEQQTGYTGFSLTTDAHRTIAALEALGYKFPF